jgi:hypothetical protein
VDTKTPSKDPESDEMGRLEKVPRPSHPPLVILTRMQLIKKYERGDLPKNDWLDKLAFRRIEEIHAVCTLLQGFAPADNPLPGRIREIGEDVSLHRPPPFRLPDRVQRACGSSFSLLPFIPLA